MVSRPSYTETTWHGQKFWHYFSWAPLLTWFLQICVVSICRVFFALCDIATTWDALLCRKFSFPEAVNVAEFLWRQFCHFKPVTFQANAFLFNEIADCRKRCLEHQAEWQLLKIIKKVKLFLTAGGLGVCCIRLLLAWSAHSAQNGLRAKTSDISSSCTKTNIYDFWMTPYEKVSQIYSVQPLKSLMFGPFLTLLGEFHRAPLGLDAFSHTLFSGAEWWQTFNRKFRNCTTDGWLSAHWTSSFKLPSTSNKLTSWIDENFHLDCFEIPDKELSVKVSSGRQFLYPLCLSSLKLFRTHRIELILPLHVMLDEHDVMDGLFNDEWGRPPSGLDLTRRGHDLSEAVVEAVQVAS